MNNSFADHPRCLITEFKLFVAIARVAVDTGPPDEWTQRILSEFSNSLFCHTVFVDVLWVTNFDVDSNGL